jgi:hypothetical protein
MKLLMGAYRAVAMRLNSGKFEKITLAAILNVSTLISSIITQTQDC